MNEWKKTTSLNTNHTTTLQATQPIQTLNFVRRSCHINVELYHDLFFYQILHKVHIKDTHSKHTLIRIIIRMRIALYDFQRMCLAFVHIISTAQQHWTCAIYAIQCFIESNGGALFDSVQFYTISDGLWPSVGVWLHSFCQHCVLLV